jgi:hypothetical protein
MTLFALTGTVMASDGGIELKARGTESPAKLISVTEKWTEAGRMVEKEVDMIFFNPNSADLAGELCFPLPNGGIAAGLAIETEGGEMRDAVAMERKTRRTPENGLSEHPESAQSPKSLDNKIFKAGAFNLRTKTARRVRVAYVEAAETAPAGQDFIWAGRLKGKRYFYAEVPAVEIFSAASAVRRNPAQISVLWDASLSGETRNRRAELTLLSVYLGLIKNVRVRLQVARDSAEPVREFDVSDGDWHELREALSEIRYDGPRRLEAFDTGDGSDVYLLFSNGIDGHLSHVDRKLLPSKNAPIFAIASSNSAEHEDLRRVAARTGGALLDISPRGGTVRDALSSLIVDRPILVRIESSGAYDFTCFPPKVGDATVAVAGVMSDETASVTLVFAKLGETGDKRFRDISFEVDAQAKPSRIAPLAWAYMRLAKLEAERDFYRGAILRIGMEFGLAASWTSLIIHDEK